MNDQQKEKLKTKGRKTIIKKKPKLQNFNINEISQNQEKELNFDNNKKNKKNKNKKNKYLKIK